MEMGAGSTEPLIQTKITTHTQKKCSTEPLYLDKILLAVVIMAR